MNPFDAGILSFFNGFARHSRLFDSLVSLSASNQLTKGGVITALFWWSWSRRGSARPRDREYLVAGLFSSLLAVFVARGLSVLVPFRERPLRNLALNFLIPYGTDSDALIHWSSFPSDHAAIFTALSVSILFVSRRAGLLALGYSLLVICLPRVYMGIHYPTDILAGVAIGACLACLVKIDAFRSAVSRPALSGLERSPGAFHALLFLLTFQIAATFDPLRVIARGLIEMARPRALSSSKDVQAVGNAPLDTGLGNQGDRRRLAADRDVALEPVVDH